MAKILFREGGSQAEINIGELTDLLRGASIYWISEAKDSNEGIWIKTSDSIQLSISTDAQLSIFVEAHDPDQHRIKLFDSDGHAPSALEVERRIHALRQLYALIFLVHEKRAADIPKEADSPTYDLEGMLSKKDQLRFSSLGVGSLWGTLQNWTEGGRKAITTLTALFVPEAQELLLRRLRARTISEEQKARSDVLDADKKDFDIKVHKAKEAAKFLREVEKMAPDARDRVLRLFERELDTLQLPRPTTRVDD